MKDFILGLSIFCMVLSPFISAVLVLCGVEWLAMLVLCAGLGLVIVTVAVLVCAVGKGLRG